MSDFARNLPEPKENWINQGDEVRLARVRETRICCDR